MKENAKIWIATNSIDGEQWKPVSNTNERYVVSDLGRLLTTGYRGSQKCQLMKPAKDANGYLRTVLLIDGKLKTIKLHRIVALEFITNPFSKSQVNHVNFIRDDNRVVNLEWTTPKENCMHSYSNGRIKQPICTNFVKGSKVGTSKLNEEQVLEIRSKFKPRICTRKMLAAEYGVSHHTIKDVILRRWKHI